MKTATIFIDGNNWYHNVKPIISSPSQIDINKLANFICSANNYELKEVRWYVSVPDIRDGDITYYKHLSFLDGLKKQGIKVITRKLQTTPTKEVLNQKKEIVEALELCPACKPLVKENCENCIGRSKKREKGIDVWIAIDMIRKTLIEKECDCCILISGDADFIPALELIEKNNKEVLSAFVPIGYAYDLRKNFKFYSLGKPKIMQCLKEFSEFKKEERH